jgi:ribose transport system substrate-binding protein
MKNIYLHIALVASLLLGTIYTVVAQENLKIAVVPKSGEVLFWKSVKMGAKLEATALSGIDILWDAPSAEDKTDQQISIVEKCIANKVDGIILSPINQNALAKPVTMAMSKKIPVLIFDSALKGTPGKDYICFVGIDNRKAGRLAGEHLAKLMNGTGKAVLLRYIKGQANTTEREEGFIEALSKYKDIDLVEKDCYAGGSINEAIQASRSLQDKLNTAKGVFCPNEHSTIGMLQALEQMKLAGKINFVGFDTPSLAVNALKKGEVSALIAQDPARMGYEGVKAIVNHIRGKKIPANLDIDVKIVTLGNINDPEIQKLLSLANMTK